MRQIFASDDRAQVTNIPRFQPELAFPVLSPDMLQRVQRYGSIEEVEEGERLFSQGSRDTDLYVVLEGRIDVFAEDSNRTRRYETQLKTGQFTGELDVLSSRSAMLNADAGVQSLVIRLPKPRLRALMQSEADVGNLILQATMWRRLQFLHETSGGLTILGEARDSELLKLRRFFTQNCYPHRIVEPDSIESLQFSQTEGYGLKLPAVVLVDGRILEKPSLLTLAQEVGVVEDPDHSLIYDLIVVGAGPGGLAAAVYGASEGLNTLVVESIGPGGQAGTSSRIENYLGFPTGVSGEELAYRAQVQAQKFGAKLSVARGAVSLRTRESSLCVALDDGTEVCGRSGIRKLLAV
jgi:thioredoxin reductase (NADPH)